jgi:hypothetical protein
MKVWKIGKNCTRETFRCIVIRKGFTIRHDVPHITCVTLGILDSSVIISIRIKVASRIITSILNIAQFLSANIKKFIAA